MSTVVVLVGWLSVGCSGSQWMSLCCLWLPLVKVVLVVSSCIGSCLQLCWLSVVVLDVILYTVFFTIFLAP